MTDGIVLKTQSLLDFASETDAHASNVASQKTFGTTTLQVGQGFDEATTLVQKSTASVQGMRTLLGQIQGGLAIAQANARIIYQGYTATDSFHADQIGQLGPELSAWAGGGPGPGKRSG